MHFQGVQLYIEVMDSDSSGNDDLIDVLLINHNLPIGQPSPRQNHSGIFDFKYVMMDLSITARCVGNFQGPDCLRCLPGFAGTMCNIRINDCSCSGNGQCLDGLICDCDPGFTGELCQTNIDDCLGVNCSGNGDCLDGVNSFTCQCNPGFGGTICTEFEGMLPNQVSQHLICSCIYLIAEVEIRGNSESLASFVGGVVGGAINIIVFLVLITLLATIVKYRIRQKLKPNIDATPSKFNNYYLATELIML